MKTEFRRAWVLLTALLAPAVATLIAGPVASLPHEDNFESYPEGAPLVNGTNGWYSATLHNTETNVIVQRDTVRSGAQSAVIPFNSVLSNRFELAGNPDPVWVQLDVLPAFFDFDHDACEINPDASAQVFINSNGYFIVHDGPADGATNWSVVTHDPLGDPIDPLPSNEWVRVHIRLEYSTHKWSLYADYRELRTNISFISDLAEFKGFEIYNGGETNTYVDNVCVRVDRLHPDLLPVPDAITNRVFRGLNATNQLFEVSSTNTAKTWPLSCELLFNVWIQPGPANFSLTNDSPQTITNMYASSTLAPGAHNGTVRISTPDAWGATQEFSVAMEVMEIGTDAEVISNTVVYGNIAANRDFAVSNSGASAFNYTITNDVAWIASITPDNGTASNTPGAHAIAYASAALDTGVYTGGIFITSSDCGGATQKITAVLTVVKSGQTISTFLPADGSLFETTDTPGLSAAASSGLPVSFVVSAGPGAITGGTNLSFTASGDVSVTASQAGNANWNPAPDVTHTFTVAKAPATVTLLDLAQTYDGTPRVVAAQTVPAGLTVEIAYNGSETPPVDAGSHAVTGVVNDIIYQGSASDTLVVAKAGQTISGFLPADGTEFEPADTAVLSAEASSGLPVSFAVSAGPGLITGGSTLSFTGPGSVSVIASQAGDANRDPAPDVTHTFTVSEQPPEGDLAISPASLSNAGPMRHDAPPQSFEVWNRGQGSLSYTISADVPWLNVAPDSGTSTGEHDAITVNYSTAGLLPGIHNGAIAVTPGVGSPVTLPVSLRIYTVKDDFNGDGRTDPWFYYQPGGTWYLLYDAEIEAKEFGWHEARAAGHDYDGDGKCNLAVYYPAGGAWYVLMADNTMRAESFGWAETAPVPGDYNGDGRTDLAVYWPAGGLWFVMGLDGEVMAWALPWGGPAMTPVPADYSGDGRTDLAVYHQAAGRWYILAMSGEVLLWGLNFGWSEAAPLTGDFDGDGRSDFAVYHQAAGMWYVLTWQGAFNAIHFGWHAAAPLVGDFDGDGIDDIAVFHRDRYDAVWYLLQSSHGFRAVSSRDLRIR